MDWTQVQALGKFDLITSDNVIEHVSDPGRLIAYCSQLLNKDGIFYLTIPNAFSIGQIRKDCHYSLPGISLLDPDDGATYVKYALNQPFYDVSWYYRYHTFEHLFNRYGLSEKLLNPYQVSQEDIANLRWEYDQLLLDLQNKATQGQFPEEIAQRIFNRLHHHIQMLETDLLYEQTQEDLQIKSLQRNRIYRDYHTELWYFILRPLTVFQQSFSTQQEFYSTPDMLEHISGRQMAKILGKKIISRLSIKK
jgi:SAM-dependent methyltransferase